MALTTQSLPNYLDGAVKKMRKGIDLRFKESIYPQICKEMTTNKQTERVMDIQSLPPVETMPELAPHPRLNFVEGYAQSYTQFQYGGRVEISKPMVKFSQENLIQQCNTGLLDGSKDSKEIQIAAFYEYGETGATVPTVGGRPIINHLAADAQDIFDTGHTWRNSSQTYSNLSGTADAFTETTLFTHSNTIRRWKTEHGVPMLVTCDRIIIPPDLERAVRIVLNSTLDPTTANNAINTAKYFLKNGYLVNPFLSDTGDWYILTSDTDGRPQVYWGWKDEVSSGRNPDNESAFTQLDYSWAHGVCFATGVFKVST